MLRLPHSYAEYHWTPCVATDWHPSSLRASWSCRWGWWFWGCWATPTACFSPKQSFCACFKRLFAVKLTRWAKQEKCSRLAQHFDHVLVGLVFEGGIDVNSKFQAVLPRVGTLQTRWSIFVPEATEIAHCDHSQPFPLASGGCWAPPHVKFGALGP